MFVTFKEYIKTVLRRRLGKDDLTPLDLSDYLEKTIGFVPPGIDYFAPSRKVLAGLLNNKMREDPPGSDSLIDDPGIRHHLEEENAPEEFMVRMFSYIFSKRVDLLKEWLADAQACASILEIGDSDGLILQALGKQGVGANMSTGAVRNVQAHGVQAVQCLVEQMPFKPKSFDVVTMFETLEHLRDPIAALSVAAALARKKVIISIPSVSQTQIKPAGYWNAIPQYRQHVFEFNDRDFRSIVSHTDMIINRKGFIEIFGRPRGFAERRLYWYANHLDAWGGVARRQAYYELLPQERNIS